MEAMFGASSFGKNIRDPPIDVFGAVDVSVLVGKAVVAAFDMKITVEPLRDEPEL